MFKYMKYEIRGTYRYILGVLALALILITGIYSYSLRGNTVGGSLFAILSILLLFGIALTTFLYIVGSFRKELYEDTGYLTFTLPLSGTQILGAKLVVALFWFFVLGIVIAAYNLIMILIFTASGPGIFELLAQLFRAITFGQFASELLTAFVSGVYLLVLIYFSMAISKVTFRDRKIGNYWFIIFLLLSALLAYGQYKIAALFPYYLDLNTFAAGPINITASQTQAIHFGINIDVQQQINVPAFLYQVVAAVALFLGTGYLIEKKIDL